MCRIYSLFDQPDVVVPALLPEACSDSSTLLLHHCPLVGNRLGSPHIADELFYCKGVSFAQH